MDDMDNRDAALPELPPGEDFAFTRGRGDVLLIAWARSPARLLR